MLLCIPVTLLAGCSVTGSLHRRGYSARVVHTPKEQREQPKKEHVPGYIEMKYIDGRPTEYFVPTTLENGEQVMCMQLEEVTVVAKSRTLPERLGKVNVDFVVTLPRQLQGACRSVVVTPVLHNNGERKPLQDLTIRGALFSKVQQRDYWQYGRFIDVYNPDSLRAAQAFGRFVKYPYPEGVRLDSVVEHATDVSYHYTQAVPTAEAGKQLKITLEGRVVGLDSSSYELPPTDTLEYNISSMLTFLDTTTHYVTRIIEKYAEVRDRNYLSFRVNDTRIIDSLGDNAVQLGRIGTLMEQLVRQQEFYIDSIVLTACSSPEGTFARNAALARGRGYALRDYLAVRFPEARLDTMITVRTVAEAWQELAQRVHADETLADRDAIAALCEQGGDPDRREAELKRRYPSAYRHIREHIYPLLRSVSFRYDLRRVGMIQDTVVTTQPDTLYARGVRLLQDRRYTEALAILSPYEDLNTAVARLSLGYDNAALTILEKLPQEARC